MKENKMDLNVSGSEAFDNPTLSRSILTIDLNEIPSPASETLPSPSSPSLHPLPSLSTTSVVLWYHGNPSPAEGLAAEIPGQGRPASCGACGEFLGQALVCDGCETAFHLACARLTSEAVQGEEWVCGECAGGGVGSRRWPLGKKRLGGGVRLLDINASPPSDVDGAGIGDEEDLRYEVSRFCFVSPAASLAGGSFSDGLPLQYEDFFLLSLGEVDARPSYHDANQIWPIGYRSCWHDKITGSLFLCNVVDGGDEGPLFKIKRFSCSSLPIPYGSTILHRNENGSSGDLEIEENNRSTCSYSTYDEDCGIEMILSEPCLPAEDDVLSWLGSNSYEGLNINQDSKSVFNNQSSGGASRSTFSNNLFVGDKLDEFSVEGKSSSAVWDICTHKIIHGCRHIYEQTGSVRFFCKHMEDRVSSVCSGAVVDKSRETFSCLNKFCSLLRASKVPHVVRDDKEFQLTAEFLKVWMNQDRFGLDVDFVQEFIENVPSVQHCSQYKMVKSRKGYSASPVVSNGLLLVNARGSYAHFDRGNMLEISGRENRRAKSAAMDKDLSFTNRSLPPGKLLGSRLPPHLVGDSIQAWEFLLHFQDVLGLEVGLRFDELEAELINPWYEGLASSVQSERCKEEEQPVPSNTSKDQSGQTSSTSSDIDTLKENTHVPIQLEFEAKRQDANLLEATSSCCRYTGVVLRKCHISVLNVLVSELLSKVGIVLDPALDGSESKPRRGKKRDLDNSNLAKRARLIMHPVNELTWPELARRYMLSILCIDGSLDPSEGSIRESSKIYRCLQGDGGLLCGSLSGIAAIEADALLLAEAKKRIYGFLTREDHIVTVEDVVTENHSAPENMESSDGMIPEWARELEPVRTLPTNVGTRIRRCVYAALEKDPPEWARKTLEYSISKEIYKGNASGPTKKAVISVLQQVSGGGLLHNHKPPKERKRKMVLPVSDIIMRHCRVLLRQVASADGDKVFCNLVGRNLMNSSDNDDEGMIGCPGMVSRPLDFRTIDLRLAVGTYGGMQESFLEDVCELWSNLRTACADQSDMLQVIDTLSKKFESLYENEIILLVKKLEEYSGKECIDLETKREIDDLIASKNDIPKAPWDDGVCKVCGIDKDDDSVLLCDECDAEYHTYCLNPPLVRIPDGNWYCPACTDGESKCSQLFNRQRRKKFRGDIIRHSLEELSSLVAALEEREYWAFSVHERTMLLKVLCDELLNSAVIRQHVEHCTEASADLQQKLRSLYSEIKNLKLREDIMAARAAKVSQNPCVAGEGNPSIQRTSSNRAMHIGSSLDDRHNGDIALDQASDSHGQLNSNSHGKNFVANPENKAADDNGSCPDDDDVIGDDENEFLGNNIDERPKKRLKSEILTSPLMLEVNGVGGDAPAAGCKTHESTQSDGSVRPLADEQPEICSSSGLGSAQLSESAPPMSELQALNAELTSVRKDICALQHSIAELETQLLKVSIRMDTLGSDSAGRLYWLSAKPYEYPSVLVDSTLTLRQGNIKVGRSSSAIDSTLVESECHSNVGSNAPCPYDCEGADCTPSCSQWTSYQSDAEVRALIQWLRDDDPKERELKDSILHWQKLKFCASIQAGKMGEMEQSAATPLRSKEKNNTLNCHVTKASTLLKKKYGPVIVVSSNKSRKLQKKNKTGDEKLSRCECLEPVWISRHHCMFCHGTFLTAVEFKKHNDGGCGSNGSSSIEKNETDAPGTGSSPAKPEGRFEEDGLIVGTTRSATSVLGSPMMIKFQNEAWGCPYKLEDISSKFVTNDSIKDLVEDIGLIRSNGNPSFVPSISPHLSDPKQAFALACEDVSTSSEIAVSSRLSDNVSESLPAAASSASLGIDDKEIPGDSCKAAAAAAAGESSLGSQKLGKTRSVLDSKGEAAKYCVVRESSLRPLVGRAAEVLKQLKINLLDVEAALPEEALNPSRANLEKRLAWRAFVKRAENIYEMVQASIVLDDMIKGEYLRNEWYYWSSLSAAIRTSTLSALALRIYALDSAIIYDKSNAAAAKSSTDVEQTQTPPQPRSRSQSQSQGQEQSPNVVESSVKCRPSRRVSSRKRKEGDG